MLADVRLFQLISPTLPVGGFTYSQGLEWAVEEGWVHDKSSLLSWLEDMLQHSIATLELPVLIRLIKAAREADELAFNHWSRYLIASRETMELRKEERQRGAAFSRLLPNLGIDIPANLAHAAQNTQLAGFALAAQSWDIDTQSMCMGYTWSWLENTVMAGVKLVPLGQTHGQQILMALGAGIPQSIALAMQVNDHQVTSATPALAIASSRHETQYTRLFRS